MTDLPQEPTVDGMLALTYVTCLLDALTPRRFEQIMTTADYPLEAVMAVTRPGQFGVALRQQSRLHQAVNGLCGEATLRLLNQNMGMKIVQAAQRHPQPMMQALKNKYAELPMVERVARTLPELCARMSQMGLALESSAASLSEWAVVYRNCTTCAGVQTRQPICATIGVILCAQLQNFCGAAAMAEESECRAVGDAACSYRLSLAL